MKLAEYLQARVESQESFAKRASKHEPNGRGVSQRTISRIVSGEAITSAAIALAIIRATREEPAPGGGTVMLEDLAVVGDEPAGAAA